MIIIDKNLEHLVLQLSICDKSLIDDFSLKIQMGTNYYEINDEKIKEKIVYGSHPQPASLFLDKKKIEQNLNLIPGARVIACSKHKYSIPPDYFGLVQTKGTLARLFVQTTCNDGQIEPGFSGYITLEIVNLSPWTIELPVGSDIAQLYLIKCSCTASNPYSGRYSNLAKEGPTIAIFQD
jgi:dCTP deaminase